MPPILSSIVINCHYNSSLVNAGKVCLFYGIFYIVWWCRHLVTENSLLVRLAHSWSITTVLSNKGVLFKDKDYINLSRIFLFRTFIPEISSTCTFLFKKPAGFIIYRYIKYCCRNIHRHSVWFLYKYTKYHYI